MIIIWYLLDNRRLPNAAYISRIEESLDTRIGYFQHVIINVTWESPPGK